MEEILPIAPRAFCSNLPARTPLRRSFAIVPLGVFALFFNILLFGPRLSRTTMCAIRYGHHFALKFAGRFFLGFPAAGDRAQESLFFFPRGHPLLS